MSIFRPAAVLLAALLALASSAVAAPQPQTVALDPNLLGMVARDPWYEFGGDPTRPGELNHAAQDRMGQILAEAGVRWVRVEFIVRTAAGDPAAQIARNDYFINEVAPRHGFKVLGLLGFALVDIDPRDPQYGLVAATGTDARFGGGVNPWMRDWLDRALFVAQRYRERVAAYEILNEQNRMPVAPGFRGGEGIDPSITARLHTKFFRCLKQAQCDTAEADTSWRAGVQIVLGGLHPRGSDLLLGGTSKQPISDGDYLAALYSSAEFASYRAAFGRFPVDGLGYHPYPVEIQASLAQIDDEVARIGGRLDELRARLRTTLAPGDAAAAEVKFWITEIGYNAGYQQQNSASQAAFLRAVFRSMAARGDVATVFWFKYEDFPPGTGPDAQLWGIVSIPFTADNRCPGGACYAPSGEPSVRRPAYLALRELAGLPVYRTSMPMVRR
jgi:hypothetical protein